MDQEMKEEVESSMAFELMEYINNACITAHLKNDPSVDPFQDSLEYFSGKIRFTDGDKKSQTLYQCMVDGSVLALGPTNMSIASARMVFNGYVGALHGKSGVPKNEPNMKDIKKEVSQKIQEMKRRTRGDYS